MTPLACRAANPLALSFPLAALLAFLAVTPAGAVPIRDLHNTTTSGMPAMPYGIGTTVTVTGVVVSPDNTFSLTQDEVVVRDTTGAILVFRSSTSPYVYTLGDSVTVTGQIAQFRGVTEISNASIVTLHSTGNLAYYNDPIVLTCKQVRDSTFDFDLIAEPRESQLIRINNVTVTSGTWPAPCPGADVSLTITDATGTTQLMIDKDSPVCGSPNPSGPFDVIGILSQNDAAAPFVDNYGIRPRFTADIIPRLPGPNFTNTPTAQVVDSTTVIISWTTDVPSTSIVNYGLTTSLGSSTGDSTATAAHQVTLNGLTPNRLYYYRVVSCDAQGCRQSTQHTFFTPSQAGGQMNFYFNRSVDISLANPDTANGSVNLRQRFIDYVNKATQSIDIACYSFSDPPVTDALIARWNQGIKIRLILDAENGQSQADRLRVLGVPVITSTFGGNHLGGGIHHNKFILLDARDADISNDWVWSGSTNLSTDQLLTDANNAYEIQDYGLTQAFLVEFEEEWGSNTDVPNAANAKMGSAKSDNTPHYFNVAGVPMELWFSPSDGTEARIVEAINTADYGVAYSILVFTSDPIADAMRAKYMSIPGFYVRGVHDANNINASGTEYPEMKGIGGGSPWSPPADVWIDTEVGLLHHKYAIIDEGRTASDPIVVTGSHNWSNAANTVNDENTLIIHSQTVANLYVQEWKARYAAAGGTANTTVDVGTTEGRAFAFAVPRPNPTSGPGATSFALTVPSGGGALRLELYSVSGRRVRTLVDGAAVPGPLSVSWNGLDDEGRAVPPGVYLARATFAGAAGGVGGATTIDRKVVRIP